MSGLFMVYSGEAPTEIFSQEGEIPWLESPEARRAVKETFSAYLGQLSPVEDSRIFYTHLQSIITNLDVMHPDPPQDSSVAVAADDIERAGCSPADSSAQMGVPDAEPVATSSSSHGSEGRRG
ncbi:hypothetical protein C8R43DRAFT_955540 [Mycena crocata]|nr:hypothetical protein C8R43DRAFT_955540 [Mycena crocata]